MLSIEKRLEALESEVAALKSQLQAVGETKKNWLEERWGAFAGDPAYVEAVRLGAEWRKKENAKSLKRPKKNRKNVRS
jgi:hypothetical protein